MRQSPKIIGILALQGDFSKHEEMLHTLGVKTIQIRKPEQLNNCDGLIIPGGESTTLSKLIDQYELRKPIATFAKHKPIMGTCAGAILLSKEVNDSKVKPLGLIDISIHRNAYGRQIFSFSAPINIEGFSDDYEAIFIRAPQIDPVSDDIVVLASYDDKPILVQQKNILALTFHPELTSDTRVHEYFLEMT